LSLEFAIPAWITSIQKALIRFFEIWHNPLVMLTGSSSYREFLGAELVRRVKSNPRYSQRAFARHLGMSPGELSEVLRGRRALSPASATRVGKALGLNHAEMKHLLFLVQAEKSEPNALPTASEPSQLSLDLFAIVSDWYYFALLNLAECQDFRWNDQWIAKRLGITPTEVRLAVERMSRIGILETVRGRLVVSKDFVVAQEGVPSEAVRNYHRQILAKASAALDLQKPEDREISGATLAVDPATIPDFKKDLSRFTREMAEKYGKSRLKKEVYHLEFCLMRLSEEVNK